ncbi:MAG: MATE family efflux transporter [Pseudomonadota bacterium]
METSDTPAAKPVAPPRLTQGPVLSSLLKLVVPMIIGLIAVISQPVIDTYFVGLLGTRELAAMAYIFPVAFIVSSVLIGIGIGATAVISRSIGASDWSDVQHATLHTFLLALAATVGVAALLLPLQDQVFQLLGADETLIPLIKDYMSVYLAGMAIMGPSMISSSALRARGDVTWSSLIMIISAVTNAILDPLFIFGWEFIPALGLRGAAIASLAANLFAGAAGMALLLRGDRMIALDLGGFDLMKQNWKRILHVGLPSALTNSITPISAAILVAIVSDFGEAAVAGWGVASRIEMMALIIPLALSACIGPFVGQNMGAGKIQRMRDAMRLAFLLAAGYALLIWAVLAVFAQPIAGAFDDNPDTIAYAATYLMAAPGAYPLYAFLMITAGAFNALGIPRPNMVLYTLKLVVIYLPVALYAAPRFGFEGVVAANVLSNVIPGVLAVIWYKVRFPRPKAEPAQGVPGDPALGFSKQ